MWIDEPDWPGWWWCLQDDRTDFRPGDLVVVRVMEMEDDGGHDTDDAGRLYIEGVLSGDCVGFTGEYTGDICGKWFGPISEPVRP